MSSSQDLMTLERAQRLHATGQYEQAEAGYRQLLSANPSDPNALHLLGLLLYQQGRKEEGLALVERSAQVAPGVAAFHFNLANARMDSGKLEGAVESYRQALALQPDFPDALSNLSVALARQGKFADAATVARLVLARRPNSPEAHYNLALALRGQGQAALNGGRFAEAADFFRQAVALLPDHVESQIGLGRALAALKDPRAFNILHKVANQPNATTEAIYAYAQWLDRAGRREEAIAQLQRVTAIDPTHAPAFADLAAVCAEVGRSGEAVEAARRALELQPDNAAAAANLGAALSLVGRHEEATNVLSIFARRLEANAQTQGETGETEAKAEPLSNYLLLQHYREPFDPEAVFLAHLEFGRRFDRPHPTPPVTDRTADRKLRIGYVSGDFRTHSVAFFLEPILQRHDRSAFDVFLYSTRPERDEVTERIKRLDLQWRDISDVRDDKALEMIRADRIDILVDLSGHTGGSRLSLFGRKPAPVQASYLGYPNTTGLRAIDYKITDAAADPPETAGGLYVEHLVRLSRPAWCYRPHASAPAVASPPMLKSGRITFGCFNAARKISKMTARLWESVLAAVPDSWLLLKSREFSESAARQQVIKKLTDQGIDENRIELRPGDATMDQHLAGYAQVDIALDPFPYHGTTTTCDALYMGVPVITALGRTHVSRVGVSLLGAVGLNELVAKSFDQYAQIARTLASDKRRLSDLRTTLRERLLRSPLCDEELMTRALEDAYREMWADHLARPGPGPASSPASDTAETAAWAVRKSLGIALSGMILMRHYDQDFDPATVFEIQKQYGREFDRPQERKFEVGPRAKLRIGYVSPDFRRHAVASFIEPILASHDRQRFEIVCFSNAPNADSMTDRLKSFGHEWRDITHLPDPRAAEIIVGEKIDILVDLAGHTGDNRLPLLGLKLAPVQATYLGFPCSTGMTTIDYRISDVHADPPGNEAWHSEKLIRLPRAFYCYRPHDEAPQVTELPALASGHVTFASLNTFQKITPRMMGLWAQILARAPGSRLLVVARAELEPGLREAMDGKGIERERVELIPRLPLAQYYETYRRIDIALDTFPYNGHTTTCDCLWMGVPVVSLAGAAAVSRAGVSVLTNVGAAELIAGSPEQYVDIAVKLALDVDRLVRMRSSLRGRMADSPITNAKLITKDLETAYEQMRAEMLAR